MFTEPKGVEDLMLSTVETTRKAAKLSLAILLVAGAMVAAASMAAGPEDRARVLEHELEHAQGYGHSDDPYDVMYPQMLITGY